MHTRSSSGGETQLAKNGIPAPVRPASTAGTAASTAGKTERGIDVNALKDRLESARKRDYGLPGDVYFRRGPEILDEMMRQWEPDEAWAVEVTAAAREIFEKPEYRGTTFEDVECRGALCRMTLRHSDEKALDYFRFRGTNEEPWEADQIGVHRHLPDGTIEVTVYFSDPAGDPAPFSEMYETMQDEQP
ncbi:MAG: hypothetical protein M0R80_05535 [Proteobacteria bacterium]|nr:hypothetical protein [Pseudomonadota bacterium]